MQKKPYYLSSKEEVLRELETTEQGLTQKEAENRIAKYGKNTIQIKKKYSGLMAFIKQFKDLLAIVLIAAGALAIAFQDYQTGIVLLIIVALNSVIGFFQEFQAEKIISKLSKLIHPKTIVFREGKEVEIDSSDLVPGDIVVINEGDSVTADMRVLQSTKLQVNSFSITGESNPAHKTDTTLTEQAEIARQTNMIFTGCQIAVGNGKGVVTATGMNTEFGKIAALSHETVEELSPLQDEINNLAKQAVILSAILGTIMLIIAFTLLNFGTIEAVIFAIGIASSMVPEGLPAEVNVALALGAKRLAEKNAVVRKLSAVETLGATTFICSDKTGTLTKNEMTIERIWLPGLNFQVTGLGYEGIGEIKTEKGNTLSANEQKALKEFIECGYYSSNAKIGTPDKDHPTYYCLGDPTEGAIISLAKKANVQMNKEDQEHKEIAELPFDSDRKMMSSIRQFQHGVLIFTKGSPKGILDISSKFRTQAGEEKTISQEDRKMIEEKIKEYADQAYRVLAFAYKKADKKTEYTIENSENDLIFMGLIAIIDPPREGVREAIQAAHNAHIKTIIITGDSPDTATAIGKKIHLNEKAREKIFCVTGVDLDHINDHTLLNWLKSHESAIFSRVSPEQKLRIVGLLKSAKQIVAVTGDGVNDAPALKKSHIGIAMGKVGTEVAKEAAQIVLADDSFVTLVSAIKEGRVIYLNLKKTIVTCFTSNFAELTAVLMGLAGTGFLGLPLAMVAIHILLIDLLGEILPLMALTYDESTSDVMAQKPRNMEKHVLNRRQLADIVISGMLMGGAGYLGFLLFLKFSGQDLSAIKGSSLLVIEATTINYTIIVFSQWWNVLGRRLEYKSIFNKYFFTNRMLWLSFLATLPFILGVMYLPFLQPYTKMTGLQFKSWALVIGLSVSFMLVMEMKKLIQRKFAKESIE